ncbi:MAG: hypothetical protein UU67_C0049G0010 [Candidatus Daviesbacteria bacterium GW2011_GWB1_41_5]|uniref:Uncharacterized protein n=1 Tax=Candidatus Daviesbacteria bacterium GW2011_GWB1_41_5 TaxID=1618429 RepID=A0A0G0YSB2_9BACT|nr:MAG: hypothetical protein UU67_C0049G0010 [Candidatus Daviesbacteria bacterium GW2011_GWB1_41_5]
MAFMPNSGQEVFGIYAKLMRKLASRLAKKVSFGLAGWIRELTRFEKLLLGLFIAPLGLFIVLIAIVIILSALGYLLDVKEKWQLRGRLAELSPQIQEVKTKEVQVRLTDSQIKALPEFKECIEKGQTPTESSILKIESRLLTEISCERKLSWQTIKKDVKLNCSLIAGEGQPETAIEKKYCQIKNALSSSYQGWLDKSDNNSLAPIISWLITTSIKISLVFGGLFLVVEVLKYTIRAALEKAVK